MPAIHKRLQHFLCTPSFRFHSRNRNGPTAAVFRHGSTRREFALEHTSHCENSPQGPPGTAFTIRQVTLRAGISRFPPSSWVRVRGDRPGGREGWRLPFWSKVLRQAIPDRCPVVPRTSAVSRQDLPGPPGRPLSEFFPPNSGRVKVENEIPWNEWRWTVRVLIVEDEPRLADNMARSLRESAGYAVDIAPDGREGLFLAESSTYDLLLLDLMLPGFSGMELLTRIRKAGQHTPVLVVTARDDKESVVALLNAGADDYLTKPFDLGELLARAKALIRRGKGQPSPVLTIGDLELNTVNRTVRRGERPISLTAMEYRVLEYLAHRPRAVISKSELLEHLYDYNWEKFSNVIEVYISGLRRKLDNGSARQLIHTVRGQGYILQA